MRGECNRWASLPGRNVPPLPFLVGLQMTVGALTFDSGFVNGVEDVSVPIELTVQ